MSVAALVVSIVAALIASASAWYARSQAAAARRVADLEAERRHSETKPRYKLEMVQGEDPDFEFMLWLTLLENGPVEDVTVQVLSPEEVQVTRGSSVHEARLGSVALGQTREVRLHQTDDIAYSRLRILVTSTSTSASGSWHQVEDLTIPRPWH